MPDNLTTYKPPAKEAKTEIKKDPTIIHVDLGEGHERYIKEQQIINQIEKQLQKIESKRNDIDLDDKIQKRWDRYEALRDPNQQTPWEGASEFVFSLIMMHCDIVSIKALNQTLTAHPLMLIRSQEFGKKVDFRKREENLDYLLRLKEEVDIESLLANGVYREASVQGTSFVKAPQSYKEEWRTYTRIYNPTEEDYQRYKVESRLKLNHTNKQIDENLDKLGFYDGSDSFIPGETIYIPTMERREVVYGPKPYRVPLENLYLRPDIADLNQQPLIDEVRDYTWGMIQNKLDTNYFYEDSVEKIKKNTENYDKQDYKLHECIFYCDLNDDGKYQKYIFTIEPDSKTIMRAIYYPYEHGEACYVPYYVKPRDDNAYGYSLAEILSDFQKNLSGLVRAAMDKNALKNQPPMEVPANIKNIDSYQFKPNEFIPSTTPGSIKVLETTKGGQDNIKLVEVMQMLSEMGDGVSGGAMSGQANPVDPRAPMGKTAMLLRESNERIAYSIKALQKGNEKLAAQVESLYKQYKPEVLDEELMDEEITYIAHGTNMSINKMQELSKVERFIFIVSNLHPKLLSQPAFKNTMLKMVMDNLSGTVMNHKEELMNLLEKNEQMSKKREQQVRRAINQMTPQEREVFEEDIAKMQKEQAK